MYMWDFIRYRKFLSFLYTILHKSIKICKKIYYVNIYRESEMTELIQAAIKRNVFYENSDFIWLLGLLSSSTICTIYLYSILPQIVDFLHLTISSSDEITRVNEVCYFCLFLF